jgi:hypothetical protein
MVNTETCCGACGQKKREPRNAGFMVMLTHDERARLHEQARRRGMSLSALIRSLAFEAAEAPASN